MSFGVYGHDPDDTDDENKRPGALWETKQATEDALKQYKEAVQSRARSKEGE